MIRLLPLLLLSMPGWAQPGSRRVAVVTRSTTAPVVDGRLSEWSPGLFALSPPNELGLAASITEEGLITSDADHSAQLWLTTTPGALHLAALVTDDEVVATHEAPELYRDDGVELLLTKPDGALFHLGVSASGKAWLFSPPGASLDGLRVAAVRAPPGYSLEVTVPLTRFGATDRTLDGWKLNLAARDVDADGSAHRVWSGYRHNLVASFGQLVVRQLPPSAAKIPPCPPPKRTVVVDRPLEARAGGLFVADAGVTLRLVNYQPAEDGWDAMWTHFDTKRLADDLQRAVQVGANAIRIFVFYATFGEHQVKPELLQRLTTVVNLAASAGLVTVVSFFPFDKEFRKSAWPGMGAHLETIVKAFVGHPGIAMWDLMNEPDHAWAQDGGVRASEVEAWAREMTNRVKRADPTHLVTVGQAGHFARRDGGASESTALPFVDVVSVHGYFDEVPMNEFLARAKAIGKPVVLQEFGRTRLYWSADEVAGFDDSVCAAARSAGLSGVGAWELFDHPVGSLGWSKTPWKESEENWFGLLSTSGERWPRARSFCRCLDAPALVVRQSR